MKSTKLVKGFTEGFDIGYSGPMKRRDTSKDLPLRVGSLQDIWSKIMKEVQLDRYAGPFDKFHMNIMFNHQ